MEVLLIIPDEDLSHVKKSRDNIFYHCFMDVFCLKRCIIKEMLVIMYRFSLKTLQQTNDRIKTFT